MSPLAQALEYTLLRPDCTQAEVEKLVQTALQWKIFGVCVPPYWVKAARRLCTPEELKIVTVIGFPLGYNKTSIKLAEAAEALEDGADDLDLVINNSALKTGMEMWVKPEVARMAEMCHEKGAFLKVILETSLQTEEEIVRNSKLCADAGADFIKTSTGFSSAGAKTEHIRLIRQAIGPEVGIKASAGIKTRAFAEELITAGANRIGTSSHPSEFLS